MAKDFLGRGWRFPVGTAPSGGIALAEGEDDMPAHVKAALLKTSEQVPISGGELVLGSWQGIYVWEHRDSPHRRQIFVHVLGE